MRRAVLIALVALLAGCGGSGGGPTDDAADLVPPNALAFVTVDTDFSSAQVKSALSILDKFPIEEQLVRQLKSAIRQAGVDPAALKRSAGRQVDVAVLDVAGEIDTVGFAQPADEEAFTKQLGTKVVHTTVKGWTVFSDKQSLLDAVEHRDGKLSETRAYIDGEATLPDDAIARAWFAQGAINQAVARSGVGTSLPLNTKTARWATAALTSASGALKLEVHAKGVANNATQGASALAAQIPSGAIVAFEFPGLGKSANQAAIAQVQPFVPIDLRGLLDALGDDTIGYVRPGLPFPEVTIASKPKDVRKALAAVGGSIQKLASGAGATTSVTVDGVVLKKVDLGPFAVFYGAFDGELVVSDSQNAVSELQRKGDKLSDDSLFEQARDGAGMPEANEGFLFVNLKDGVPAAEGLAQLGNAQLPKMLDENLKPLRSLLAYGSRDGGVQSFVALLQTS